MRAPHLWHRAADDATDAHLRTAEQLRLGRAAAGERGKIPSIMPICTNCSIDSSDAKKVVLRKREPVAVASKAKIMRMVGRLVFATPCSSANPSSTSNDSYGLTSRKRNQPRDCVPSGPVMW
jgi:hypothetical protein